jgi:NADH-quinone oxidoreductase subunit L
VPPFSGWFSKDEILAYELGRADWHIVLGVLGYLGAFLTGIYTFRMIFRTFWGHPVPEAQELAHGHQAHAEVPTNPATGEEEDTDVGFPGPAHVIAERSLPMKMAMAPLAVLAALAGFLQIPRVTHAISSFLDPTFAGSRLARIEPSAATSYLGLGAGAVLGLAGVAVAYLVWVRRPGTAARLQERLSGLHRFLSARWYFDELIDGLVVRPAAWFGRLAQQSFERYVIQDTIVGGPTGVVRVGSAAVRALQTGFLRYYAALLLVGVVTTGLYFLLQS